MTNYTPKLLIPDRLLYQSRLISVTTTYCVDLSEDDFMHLKIVFPIEEVGIQRDTRLNEVAAKIVELFGTDFQEFGDINIDTRRIAKIATNFDYDLLEEIQIGGFTHGTDGGYKIKDGNHRSIALAILLHSGQIEYRPVTAILAVSKDITEDVTYETELRRDS